MLPPGLWLTAPAGWLSRTGISSGTLPLLFYFWLFTLSQKKTICNPFAHPTWKYTTLTCEVPNFFMWLKVCIVLAFSVLAFSIPADSYSRFPYMRFPSLRNALFRTCLFRTCVFQYLRFQRPPSCTGPLRLSALLSVVCGTGRRESSWLPSLPHFSHHGAASVLGSVLLRTILVA